MAFQILVNIAIALIWMIMWGTNTLIDFFIGYVVGLFLLFFLRRFLPTVFYFRRAYAGVKLILIFIKELILANIDVVRIILRPKMDINPGIIAVPTSLKTQWEITLLASLISLTPGTLSMTFSDDNRLIFVHSIHIEDRDETIREIIDTFEKAIMEVTH